MANYTFLPDTSVMYNKKIIDLIQMGNLESYVPVNSDAVKTAELVTIVLSRTMLAELENQANQNKTIESVGLECLRELYGMAQANKIIIETTGVRPTLEQIKLNPGGELDALIRRDAEDVKAVLITADEVQSTVALVEGTNVLFTMNLPELDDVDNLKEDETKDIEDYFDGSTMSVHIRGNCKPVAKRGKPGAWTLDEIEDEPMEPHLVAELGNKIIRQAKYDDESFIERNEPGVSVVQLQKYRIVICRPPFSNTYEITAVRPLVSLTLDDYDIPKKMFKRLEVAEGVLVAGSPGAGKSTFISALVLFYLEKNKLVKTLESVRDLIVPPEVSQYAPLNGSIEKTADILLLIRPDFTIFDEVRTDIDFKMFGDMRLSGVGLVGVVHASKAVDAVQRFIRRIELGVIPNVIDTIIFIRAGQVDEILSLEMMVKKPTGFADRDLSRPVIEVKDFISNELLYEIYAFGSDVIVAPVGKAKNRNYNSSSRSFKKGKGKGKTGVPADQDSDFVPSARTGESFPVSTYRKKQSLVFSVDPQFRNTYMNFYAGGSFLFSATLNRNGDVSIKQKSPVYRRVQKIMRKGIQIEASFE